MAIRKIPEDTKTFHYYNANPDDKNQNDCAIRAISVALGQSWQQTFSDLCSIGLKNHRMPNSKPVFKEYLKSKGYQMQKQPIKANGKKYTTKEFIKNCLTDFNYILEVYDHMNVIKGNKVWDTWDSSYRCVGNYWIVPAGTGNQVEYKANPRPMRRIR